MNNRDLDVTKIVSFVEMAEISIRFITKTSYDLMNGCMTCDFTSFSTAFQSYRDSGGIEGRWVMIIRLCAIELERSLPAEGLEPGTTKSVGQCLTYWGFS